MEEIQLPSGATLKIGLAPFSDAKDLQQALLAELRSIKMDDNATIDTNFFKDIFCAGFSSKAIEACLWKCMIRSTYNGAKIDKDTFEPEEARQDYLVVCYEVARANTEPFMKALMQKYSGVLDLLKKLRA